MPMDGGAAIPASSPPPTTAMALPPDLLTSVFSLLDHDSLFCALQTCKSWAAMVDEDTLWEAMCKPLGWTDRSPLALLAQQQQQRQQQRGQQTDGAGSSPRPSHLQQQELQPQQPAVAAPAMAASVPTWRQHFRRRYQASCFECMELCARSTPHCAPLVLRLCAACAGSHDSPLPWHRLMSARHARQRYCLKQEGEAGGGGDGSGRGKEGVMPTLFPRHTAVLRTYLGVLLACHVHACFVFDHQHVATHPCLHPLQP